MVSYFFTTLFSSVLLASVSAYATAPEPPTGFGSTIASNVVPQVAGIDVSVEDTVLATSTEIIFTGDIMLARNVETLMRSYGEEYPFGTVSDRIQEADIAVGNFEAAMPSVHQQTESMTFNFSVHEQYLDRLEAAGFSHLSQANNHGYDYGKEGYENARTAMIKRSMTPFGYPRGISGTSVTYFDTAVGERIALIGLEAFSNTYSNEEIKELLTSASNKSDFQIVYIHWGNEYELTHSAAQKKLAKRLIDAGADLIVGHHPHVVQDIEIYNDVLIFYSLGNFVFDQYFSQDVQEGLLISLHYEAGERSIELLPITSIGSKSLPRLMPAHEKGIFLRALSERSDTALSSMIRAGELTFW